MTATEQVQKLQEEQKDLYAQKAQVMDRLIQIDAALQGAGLGVKLKEEAIAAEAEDVAEDNLPTAEE